MLTDYFHVQLQQSVGIVLPLDSTTEVINLTLGEICPIPGIPPAVLGVVNQRGRLLWVVELSELLGLAPSQRRLQSQDRLTIVVIAAKSASSTVGQEFRQLGCVVSALKGIVPLDSAKFKPVSRELFSTLGSFLSGVAEIENSLFPDGKLPFSSGEKRIEQSPVAVLNTDAVLTALSGSTMVSL